MYILNVIQQAFDKHLFVNHSIIYVVHCIMFAPTIKITELFIKLSI